MVGGCFTGFTDEDEHRWNSGGLGELSSIVNRQGNINGLVG